MKKWIQIAAAALVSAMAAMSVSAGEVFLYDNPNFQDPAIIVRSDVPDMNVSGLAIQIGSIRVVSGNWEICTQREYRGECRVFGPGEHRDVSRGRNDIVASVREARHRPGAYATDAAPRIEVYPDVDFRGAGRVYAGDTDNVRWGVRSLIVHSGAWELCTDTGFRGRCQVYQPGQYREIDPQLGGARSARALAAGGREVNPIAAIAGVVLGATIGSQGAQQPVTAMGPGGRIHFYPGPLLTGRPLTLTADQANFVSLGFNDRSASIRVESGYWEVCSDINFGGACRVVSPGDYPDLVNSMLDRAISSARMVRAPIAGLPVGAQDGTYPANAPETPHNVLIFSDNDFRGESFRASGNIDNLGDTVMNDRSASIYVRQGRWEFCEHSRYRGTCATLGPGSYGILQYPLDRGISSFRRVQ